MKAKKCVVDRVLSVVSSGNIDTYSYHIPHTTVPISTRDSLCSQRFMQSRAYIQIEILKCVYIYMFGRVPDVGYICTRCIWT